MDFVLKDEYKRVYVRGGGGLQTQTNARWSSPTAWAFCMENQADVTASPSARGDMMITYFLTITQQPNIWPLK